MQNKRFKTKKINSWLLESISISDVMSDKEKLRFMRFVWYMTDDERKELIKTI